MNRNRNQSSNGCQHKLRKIYHHGKKSKPLMVCKICGKIIAPQELSLERRRKEKARILKKKNGGRRFK
tara:strand:- start:60 stop:263 length:204 start_codon:yes stop_codon:yes gene_type:complete